MKSRRQTPALAAVLEAINRLFSDTSVPIETTLEYMEEIENAVTINIEALRDDLRAKRAAE